MDLSPDAPVRAQAETYIDAIPEDVWDVLIDLERWPEWNSSVSRMDVQGPVSEGTEFRWKVGLGSIRSVVHVLRPPEFLAWSGHTFGIRAVHIWRLRAEGAGTRVWTGETFEGVVPRLMPGSLKGSLQETLDDWLAALKEACETA